MTLHTYTFQPMSLPLIDFPHLCFLGYSPDKNIVPATHPPIPTDAMGENNTCTAFKGCGVKIKKHFFW